MSKLITYAKQLRKQSTDTEQRLWRLLRANRFYGWKFRRQEPIGPYIVDFVCFEHRVIIECDGGQHATQTQQDNTRDHWLGQQGFRVVRFWDNDIFTNIEGVLQTILHTCQRPPSPSSPPLKGGEKIKRMSPFPSASHRSHE